jgi:carbonic anhydrase
MEICDCGRHEARRSGRRAFLGGTAAALGCAAVGGVMAPLPARAADPAVARTTFTPEQALSAMKEGNNTFKTEAPFRAVQGRERRLELARGQAPFCVLVGCSDSRVSPELLFGRGLGELFIIRNAGNTVDTAALGSIEYGVGVLGCPLIVVLGHEACGAVAAAVDVVEKNATFPGVIGEMIQPIIPAVLDARRASGGTLLHNSVVANAKRVATRLKTQSPVLQETMRSGKLKVVPAHYDFDDGHVDFFEE